MPLRRFRTLRSLLLSSAALLIVAVDSAAALGPEGERVAEGLAQVSRPTGALTLVEQMSQRAVIDWSSFDVAAGEEVRFVQPGVDAAILNRVNDIDASVIDGLINGDGRVFFTNPHGFLFGADARVDLGALVVSTADIDNRAFMAGDYAFDVEGAGDGAIVNRGNLSADAVALMGPHIVNEGFIGAKAGTVALAGGSAFTLDFTGDGLLSVAVTEGLDTEFLDADGAVVNLGEVAAEGGAVLVTATARDAVKAHLIRLAGETRVGEAAPAAESSGDVRADETATSADSEIAISDAQTPPALASTVAAAMTGVKDASIRVEAIGGGARVDGVLDTSFAGGVGGAIDVTGDVVQLTEGAALFADGAFGGGRIRVGGAFQGGPGLRAAERTLVAAGAAISASATQEGNGGEVIVWADDWTDYRGDIFATGGLDDGDGGFVEVSGKRSLGFTGFVDTSAPTGQAGTLLLDPDNITIVDGGPAADDDEVLGDNQVLQGDVGTNFTISNEALEALTGDITLEATNDISFEAAVDFGLGKRVDIIADADGDGIGLVRVQAPLTIGGTADAAGLLNFVGADFRIASAINSLAGDATRNGVSFSPSVGGGVFALSQLSSDELNRISADITLIGQRLSNRDSRGFFSVPAATTVPVTVSVDEPLAVVRPAGQSIGLWAQDSILIQSDLTFSGGGFFETNADRDDNLNGGVVISDGVTVFAQDRSGTTIGLRGGTGLIIQGQGALIADDILIRSDDSLGDIFIGESGSGFNINNETLSRIEADVVVLRSRVVPSADVFFDGLTFASTGGIGEFDSDDGGIIGAPPNVIFRNINEFDSVVDFDNINVMFDGPFSSRQSIFINGGTSTTINSPVISDQAISIDAADGLTIEAEIRAGDAINLDADNDNDQMGLLLINAPIRSGIGFADFSGGDVTTNTPLTRFNDFTITAADNVVIASNIQLSDSASALILADSDANGVGTLSIEPGIAVSGPNGSIDLAGADFEIDPTATITTADGGTTNEIRIVSTLNDVDFLDDFFFDVGDTQGARLSSSEINSLEAYSVVIGAAVREFDDIPSELVNGVTTITGFSEPIGANIGAGGIRFAAANELTVSGDVVALTDVFYDAARNGNGVGALSLTGDTIAENRTVTLSANAFDIAGSIDTASADPNPFSGVNIVPAIAAELTLGAGGEITQAELDNINANQVTFGGVTDLTGAVTAFPFASVDVLSPIALSSPQSPGPVYSFFSTGNITQTADLVADGAVVFDTPLGVSIENGATLSADGGLTINADADFNGVGDVSVAEGAAVLASAGAAILQGAAFDLDGAVDAAEGTSVAFTASDVGDRRP